MLLTAEQYQRIRSYLLSQLPEEERESIEHLYFDDDEWFEQVQAAEGELIRDYLAGALPQADRSQFEAVYLTSPVLRQKVEDTRLIVREMKASSRTSTRVSVLKFLHAPFTVGRWQLAFQAISVFSVGGFLWMAVQNQTLRHQVTALEAAHRTSYGAGSAPATVPTLSFVLSPGTVRGEGPGQTRIRVPAGSYEVRLTLRLPSARGFGRFHGVLETVDGVTAGSSVLDPLAPDSLAMRVNSAALMTGDYILRVYGDSATGESKPLETYSFGITRK